MAEYPDTPWWSNLLAVIITIAVAVPATILYVNRDRGTGSIGSVSAFSGLGGLVKDTLVYIPHALLLFGVIADMLTYQGVYSIASFVGLLSLPTHLLFKFIWQGTFDVIEKLQEALTRGPVTPTPNFGARANAPTRVPNKPEQLLGGASPGSFFRGYDGCDIQGFGLLHSRFSPQSLVVIATIFSYYVFDLIANRGWKNATATIMLGGFFYVVQLLLQGDCTVPGEEPVSTWVRGVLAAVEGMFVGGVSYSVVQAYYPKYLPTTAISPFPKTTPGDLKDGKFDKDGNPWVCVNGVCYPDMSTDSSRKAFAQMAAESTGNGRAAVGANCPAN